MNNNNTPENEQPDETGVSRNEDGSWCFTFNFESTDEGWTPMVRAVSDDGVHTVYIRYWNDWYKNELQSRYDTRLN